jgi:hypothetical protein
MILSTLTYEEGRKFIQDGDLLFVANKKGIFLPQLIRFFTKSIFSHVAIAFWIDTAAGKRLLAVQAQGGNKRFVMNADALDKCDIYVMTSPTEWAKVAPQALIRLNEVPYGWFEAIYVGLREFLMTRFNITLPEKSFTGEICSEFVARVIGLTNVFVSPQLLYSELIPTQTIRCILKN